MLCKICKEHHLKLELKLNKRIKNENLFGINIKHMRDAYINANVAIFIIFINIQNSLIVSIKKNIQKIHIII